MKNFHINLYGSEKPEPPHVPHYFDCGARVYFVKAIESAAELITVRYATA